MKKNKGFTLIELLAVIVVLAIIALIATPIVMNTIKSSKKGAAEQSGENYIKQVETSLMEYRTKTGNMVPDGTYQINSDGNLEGEGLTEPLKIEMNGKKPSDGEIVIENGMVKRDTSSMVIGTYSVAYNTTSKSYVAVEKSSEPESPYLCQAVTELSTQGVSYGLWETETGEWEVRQEQTGVLASAGDPYAYGVEYSCNLGDGVTRTFYVLEDGDTTTLTDGRIAQAGEVSLIASENIITSSGWCNDPELCYELGQYEDGYTYANFKRLPLVANNNLASSTTGWTKLNPSQISLPTYNQIYTVAGNSTYSLPTWVSENLSYGNGYWTSSMYNQTSAWFIAVDSGNAQAQIINYEVGSNPILGSGNYNYSDILDHVTIVDYIANGIRPVITISKTKLAN